MSDNDQTQVEETTTESPEIDIEARIQAAVDERLSKVKENLDKAYGERDELAKALEAAKTEKQNVEIAALEAQGKATEALELRMKQMEEANAKLLETNTALTRDRMVMDAVAGMDFASDKAARMASSDLTGVLSRAEDGSWRGPNGESIQELAQNYASDEANAFLFKAKVSSGSSMPTGKTVAADPQSTKSLANMSVEEAIAAAASGALDGGKRWI